MTTTNPILDELHAVREQMLADAGGTLAGLVAKIQADQARSGCVVLKKGDIHSMHQSGEAGGWAVESLSSPPDDQ